MTVSKLEKLIFLLVCSYCLLSVSTLAVEYKYADLSEGLAEANAKLEELRAIHQPRMLQQVPSRELSNYKIIDTKGTDDDDDSILYLLQYYGEEDTFGISKVITKIGVQVTFDKEYSVRVKIYDVSTQRWEIPETFPFPYFKDSEKLSVSKGCCEVIVEGEPFSLIIKRKDTHQVIFDTKGKQFAFSDYYLELGAKVPTPNIYGYGERYYDFKLRPGVYTIWARDEPKVLQSPRGGGHVYGHQPVGLIRDGNKDYFIVFLRNSNAMDIVIGEEPSITFKVVGGIFDFVFFLGDKRPDTVIKRYHDYIGHFVMMPFWSMGLHQSRWGYNDIGAFERIIRKYNEYDIPLDVIWSDIDYMVEKEDFTMNTRAFPPKKLTELLTSTGKRWVPIIDAGIKNRGRAKDVGVKMDIFMKKKNGGIFTGRVWPGD